MLRYIITVRFLAGDSKAERTRKDRIIEESAGLCYHQEGIRLRDEGGHSILMRFVEFHFPRPEEAAHLHQQFINHRPIWAELEEEVEVRG
ncbi:MAG: hypothetical protein MUO81_06915 [Thermoplasmata archaeon]|nr:hypothetical protein [Thermoplasmata archaeon]